MSVKVSNYSVLRGERAEERARSSATRSQDTHVTRDASDRIITVYTVT